MADTQENRTVLIVLDCIKKVSKFASTLNPLLDIVTALVGETCKGLKVEEIHALYKDFQKVHSQLESKGCLRQISIKEVSEDFGQHEECIKNQYEAFSDMVTDVKKDPENAESHMKQFKEVYEKDKLDNSLDVYYRGVMGTCRNFGRPLLSVYLKYCSGNREVMEKRCSYLCHLFYKGLIAHMGYTVVIKDDEDEVREKWEKRMKEIQEKMQEVLSQCN